MVDRAKRLLRQANRRQTVGGAAIIISAAYLLSRLLGLLRDRLLVAHFGIGPVMDSYAAAFRIPEILFTLLVSGAFAVAFIPVLTEHLEKNQRDVAWRITSSLLNLLVIGTAAAGLLIAIFADPIVTLITPGYDGFRHDLTVELTRIMLITPVLFAISSVLGSVQQAFNRFVFFALAGVFYNVGIIAGILWLAPRWGIYGAAWGVVLGVVLQAMLQVLGLIGLGFRFRLEINVKLSGVRQTLKLMLPRSIDQGIDQVNYAAETIISSTLPAGSFAAFTFANNLKNVPLVLIASSITTAVFPQLARRAASGERQHLIEAYVQTARLILFLAIPSALLAFIARGYIVRLLYASGDPRTAAALGWFAGTIVFTSLYMLVSRVYYAMQDTRTPLTTSIISIPVNILLSFLLSRHYGIAGLAMSASIVAMLETLALLVILRRREGHFGERQIVTSGLRMLLAGGIMVSTVYLTIVNFVPLYAADKGFAVLAPKFVLILLVATISYLVPCYLLRLNEAKQFLGRLRDVIGRTLNLT
ncbi:MAG TPA: murein biosynthesis integral membrane protein MurJ [Candidatus Saccharimonadia bacterium]